MSSEIKEGTRQYNHRQHAIFIKMRIMAFS